MTLTTQTIENLHNHDDWGGFGYLGERRNNKDRTALVALADDMALKTANAQNMSEEKFFEWANSKTGRWYGDCWFGANGRDAEKYLPRS